MSRWRPGARERLERSALELFTEQGFARTTVPQITERAGLTTRTFFRHFADKREVLFAAQADLPGVVASLVAQAPPQMPTTSLIAWGLDEVARTRFAGQHEQLRARRAVIRSDAGLGERELHKHSVLAGAIEAGLRQRGLDETSAAVAARAAVAVLDVSVERWLDGDDERALPDLLHESMDALTSLLTPGQGRAPGRRGHPTTPATNPSTAVRAACGR